MTNEQDPLGGDEASVDELGRSAGAALRRPPPADGLARVRSSQRRRRTVQAVAGASAVAVLGIGLFVAVDRGGDGTSVVTDTVPVTSAAPSTTLQVVPPPSSDPTTSSGAVPPPTIATTTTTPTSTPTAATGPPATEPPPPTPTGWQRATQRFPSLAFIACCGSNWEGEPSPAVPSDPAAPLPAGLYNVRAVIDDQPADDFTDGVLTLEVRPYVRCDELGEFECNDQAPHPPEELGVPTAAARTIDVTLDDSVQVAVAGFGCDGADQLVPDEQVATGSDLTALFLELDAAYEAAVAVPLRNGADPEQLADDLAASSPSGFSDPGCPSSNRFAWTPSSGPSILARLDLFTVPGLPAPEPVPSASVDWITPTALVVDESDRITVHLYAGFLS